MLRRNLHPLWSRGNINGSDHLARGLVMWMPLNDGGGTLTQEITGWGATRGTFVSSAAWSVGGPFGKCVNLPNAGSITIPSSSFDGPQYNFTMSLWVNIVNFTNFNGVISKTNSNVAAPYDWYLIQSSGQPRLFLGPANQVDASAAPALGVWQFLAVTGNGTSSSVAITHYLNGRPNGSGTTTSTATNGSNLCIIGNRGDGVTQMNGLIADARIYNRALLPSEISMLYQNPLRPLYISGRNLGPVSDFIWSSLTPGQHQPLVTRPEMISYG